MRLWLECPHAIASSLSARRSLAAALANYCNGLAMVGQFVYSTYEIDAEALAMPTTPPGEESTEELRADRPSSPSFGTNCLLPTTGWDEAEACPLVPV